jgi:hypothetical protein
VRTKGVRRVALGEIGDGFDVEIENVEPRAARRPVRTRFSRLTREERVQWIHPHDSRARAGREFGEVRQVAEIPDAPVSGGPERVKLNRGSPHSPAVGENGRLVAASRANDQLRVAGSRAGFEQRAVVISAGRGCRQLKVGAYVRLSRDFGRRDLRQLTRSQRAGHSFAVFQLEDPFVLGTGALGGKRDLQRWRFAHPYDLDRRQHVAPMHPSR